MSHGHSATPATGHHGVNEGRSGIDLLARSFRRHWRSTLILTVSLSAIIIGVLALLPPRYSASAFLMVASRPNVVNIQDVMPALTMDVEGMASEVEILRSRDLAKSVAEILHFSDIPQATATDGWHGADAVMTTVKEWIKDLIPSPPLPPEERVITYLLNNQDVKPLGKSRVVEIRFSATSPEIARDVANGFARAYVDRQVSEKTKASINAKVWVDNEIDRVRQQVQANERKLEDFRAHSGLLDNANKQLLPFGEIAELDHRLTMAQSEYTATKGRVDEVKRLLHSGSLVDALPETIGSPALQALRQRETKLTIDLASMSQQYGPESDRIRRVEAEMAEVKSAIRNELSRIADGLQSEASLAANEVASLKASLNSAKEKLESSSGQSVALLSLQREVEAGTDLLVTLLKRQNELAAQTSLQTADAQLISAAALPRQPSFPKMVPMAILALIGASAASVGFNLVRDLKERVVRSAEEIAALVPFQPLGLLPRFRSSRQPNQLKTLTKDRSRFLEAVKNLYIQISPPHQSMPRTIVVTSALSGEGKTTTAVSLAMLAASLDRSVALVDFDTRRPSVHHILRLPLGPGLMEYMAGEATLTETLQYSLPNLTVVTAGRGSDFNSIVRSDRVEALLQELMQKFDQVIIDTPPSLAVVDSLVVARIADRVVQVVRWGQTTHETIKAAAKLFTSIDPQRIGVVLAQVDVDRHALDGYADSVIYHKSLNRYYMG